MAHNRSKNYFENPIGRQRLIVVRAGGAPRRIDHITNAHIRKTIVELPQSLCRAILLANLEELNADLVRGCLELVELLGVVDDDALRVVGWAAVCDDNYVDGFSRVQILRFA